MFGYEYEYINDIVEENGIKYECTSIRKWLFGIEYHREVIKVNIDTEDKEQKTAMGFDYSKTDTNIKTIGNESS